MKTAGRRGSIIVGVVAVLVGALVTVGSPSATAQTFGYSSLNDIQKRHVSGLLATELGVQPAARSAAPLQSTVAVPQRPGPNGCAARRGGNVKVNQNCLNLPTPTCRAAARRRTNLGGRRPEQPRPIWSPATTTTAAATAPAASRTRSTADGPGRTPPRPTGSPAATSSAPPGSTGRRRATHRWPGTPGATPTCPARRSTAATASSPNPDQSSAFYVYRSTGTNGASFNFPGRPVADARRHRGRRRLPARQAADDRRQPPGQPVRATGSTSAGRRSPPTAPVTSTRPTPSDYGESFSEPVLVSADSALCGNTFGLPTPQGRCNENQDSQPFTAPTAPCTSSTTTSTTSSPAPTTATRCCWPDRPTAAPASPRRSRSRDYYELPDCDTYQGAGADPGRACVPEKGASHNSMFRATQLPDRRGRPDRPQPGRGHLRLLHQPQLQRDTAAAPRPGSPPTASTSTPASRPAAATTTSSTACPPTGRAPSPARRSIRGSCPSSPTVRNKPAPTSSGRAPPSLRTAPSSPRTTTGPTVTTTPPGTPTSPCPRPTTGSTFAHRRATSSSMPPPTQFAGSFYGDYAGIAVTDATAYPIWSDTRTARRVPLPRHRNTEQPTDRLHRVGAQRTLRQRPRHLPHRCTNPLMPHSWARAFPCS